MCNLILKLKSYISKNLDNMSSKTIIVSLLMTAVIFAFIALNAKIAQLLVNWVFNSTLNFWGGFVVYALYDVITFTLLRTFSKNERKG